MHRSFLFAVGGVSILASAASAAVRMPLMEEFTNAQCAPCASADPTIRAFIAQHPDDLAVVYWHMNWPGFDPFWQDNPADNQARRVAYGVNAVPETVFDGVDQGHPLDTPGLATRYNSAAAVPSSLNITMDGTRVVGSGMGTVTVDMTADTDLSGVDLRLFVVMAENDVEWNGIGAYDLHHFVARKTLSGSSGEPMEAFTASETRSRTYNWELNPDWIVPAEENSLVFIAFVQDNQAGTESDDVLNAMMIHVADFTGTVAVGPVGDFIIGGIGANYPNPFNPLTHIPIYMASTGNATVTIHAADGSLVRTLASRSFPVGGSTLTWDGRSDAGAGASSGVYFVRLTGDGVSGSRAITLLK